MDKQPILSIIVKLYLLLSSHFFMRSVLLTLSILCLLGLGNLLHSFEKKLPIVLTESELTK